jgi:hypothetical protein
MKHSSSSLSTAARIMSSFAADTGLSGSAGSSQRYLWTDAFAVCNFLGLFEETGDAEFRNLALRLVRQVHLTLGRYREDDSRQGWISGLGDAEGQAHPTIGGLRIGKKLPERRPEEPFDERGEWDRDGQYYHYLTRWMHALCRTWQTTGQVGYLQWAEELALTANERFIHHSPVDGRPYVLWKMSIDLSRPLVSSMGHHDPLDGWTACLRLLRAGETADLRFEALRPQLERLDRICRGRSWATADPLGLGGLLCDAGFLARMAAEGAGRARIRLEEVMQAAIQGLSDYAKSHAEALPAAYRLAFRELGLAIGLKGVPQWRRFLAKARRQPGRDPDLPGLGRKLSSYGFLAEDIEKFWAQEKNQATRTWQEHRDINRVMLATCLVPGGYLPFYNSVP